MFPLYWLPDNGADPDLIDPALYQEFSAAAERIAELYESRRYNQAIREIMALADKANLYIDE